MDANLDTCVAFTSVQEGGYSALYDDAGNWTGGAVGHGTLVGSNMGISAPTLVSWNPRVTVTPAYMRALPKTVQTAILGARYWNTNRCGELPSGIDLMMLDFGFNAGSRTAAMLLQEAVGFCSDDLDGSIGLATLGVVLQQPVATLISTLATMQGAHYAALHEARFEAGWLARTARRKAAALALVPFKIG
ncbi:MAG: glycosyl hydrolase 108 family protein [Janthinobacterium lividum]